LNSCFYFITDSFLKQEKFHSIPDWINGSDF
jgi:hypothetical protein